MRQMKDSGLPWVGLIPDTWLNCRNDSVFTERKEFCTADEPMEKLLSVSEYYGVAKRTNKMEEGEFISRAETLDGYRRCHKGDLVMNYMLAWKGSQATTQYDGVVSPAYAVFKPLGGMLPQFAHFLFRTSMYCTVFEMHSTGIIKSRLRLYPDSFLHLHSILPPLEEQHRIVNFLDKKCAEIDSLTSDVQKEIETLQEYRRSIITEAVTKGLDPDVEMKDSGVSYIGMIPRGWEVKRLRFLGRCQNGISKGHEFFGDEGDPFVSYSDVYKNETIPNPTGVITSTKDEQYQYSVKEGDIFFTRTSETIDEIGFSSVCLKTIPRATFAGFLIRVRPITKLISPRFSRYYFRSDVHRKYFVKEMNLVTRASLGQNLLKNLPVLLPPLSEQERITSYLDTKCTEIDSIIEVKQKQLETLAEYRKSLIYEYVTGKKEVV